MRLLIRQREVLLRLVEQHGVLDGEGVIVALADDVSCFRFGVGAWQKSRVMKMGASSPLRFVLCAKGIFSRVEKKLGLSGEKTIFRGVPSCV